MPTPENENKPDPEKDQENRNDMPFEDASFGTSQPTSGDTPSTLPLDKAVEQLIAEGQLSVSRETAERYMRGEIDPDEDREVIDIFNALLLNKLMRVAA